MIGSEQRTQGIDSHDTRVALERVNIADNVLPQLLKDSGGPGKVKTGEIGVTKGYRTYVVWRAGKELNDVCRQPSFMEDLKEGIARKHRHRTWFPEHDIS